MVSPEEQRGDALNAVRGGERPRRRRFSLEQGSAGGAWHQERLTDERRTILKPTPRGDALNRQYGAGESALRELGLDYERMVFSTYGRDQCRFFLLCVRVFRAGEKMTMTAYTQLWNFMYIDDAGRALADLAEYAGNLADHGCVYKMVGHRTLARVCRDGL